MNLVGMLLNQLSTNPNISQNTGNNSSNGGFENFLNNAQNKVSNNNNYNKNVKNTNKDINKNIPKKQSSVKQESSVSNKSKSNSVSVDKEEVIIVDEKTLSKLEELLGLDANKILDILASLSMSVSMLQQPEHLIAFLQEAFNVESPVELLSMDNMKNIMDSITKIAKGLQYDDIVSINDDNLKAFLEQMNEDVKIVVPNSEGNENLKAHIERLLEKLNGKVLNDGEEINDINKDILNVKNVDELNVSKNSKVNENVENEEVDLKPMPKEYLQQSFNQNNGQNASLLSQENKNILTEVEINEEAINVSSVENGFKLFNTSLPKTQVIRNINQSDVINQIMDKIKVSIKPDVSEIKMLLKPEQLGEITLKISTQNGIVTAQFIAESQRVKEIIEANFNQLRDMLSEQGVDVGALEVNVSSENKGENAFYEQDTSSNEKDLIDDEDKNKNSFIKTPQEDLLNSNVNYSI